MSKRIALFIDGAHLQRTTKNLGFDVDYTRLLQEFGKYGSIIRAYFYTIEKDEEEGSSIHPLIDWLGYNGFTTRRKRIREYDDGNGRRRKARHIGIELAIDALEIARYVDQIFLFSGDGDFRPVTDRVQRLGVRVTVVSSLKTTPSMIADELRRKADEFLELHSLRRAIERLQCPPEKSHEPTKP